MSLINIQNLTFAYDGSYDNIFENVSVQLDTDWRLGLIGRNGRGKTTLLNLLLGKYAYSGAISASVDFEYFPYEVRDKTLNTIDLVAEILPDFEEWRLYRELNLLEVCDDALYRPFCTLSNGEQTKILLAVLFLRENSFLLIDEPTNHLDIEARCVVSRYLSGKNGYILVSHDRSFLDGCIDHVLSINRADIVVQRGNFTTWQENKEMRDACERTENERLKKEIGKLNDAIKRSGRWADKNESEKIGYDPLHDKYERCISTRSYIGAKTKKMQKRRKDYEQKQMRAIDEKEGLLKNVEYVGELKIHPLEYRAELLVQLDKAGVKYGGKTVCENVSFDIRRGDRIALRGKNGCGKSSILKAIRGEDIETTGSIIKGSGLAISYICQDTSALHGTLTEYARESGIDETLFKAILNKFDFRRTQFDKPIEAFSGGQKKKVLIARSLSEQAHLYIWDEPLNFIDVLSRMQLEELLREYSPTILFVEHDKTFCDNIATKTVIM